MLKMPLISVLENSLLTTSLVGAGGTPVSKVIGTFVASGSKVAVTVASASTQASPQSHFQLKVSPWYPKAPKSLRPAPLISGVTLPVQSPLLERTSQSLSCSQRHSQKVLLPVHVARSAVVLFWPRRHDVAVERFGSLVCFFADMSAGFEESTVDREAYCTVR